jgi:hypothetical protein
MQHITGSEVGTTETEERAGKKGDSLLGQKVWREEVFFVYIIGAGAGEKKNMINYFPAEHFGTCLVPKGRLLKLEKERSFPRLICRNDRL